MRTPFRKGMRVVLANDMTLFSGRVTDPRFDLGEGNWGVCVMVAPQPNFEEWLLDPVSEVDVCYAYGIFKGYTGPSTHREPDGSMELFIVQQNSGEEIRRNQLTGRSTAFRGCTRS